jgi:hypothetical protein
MPLPDQRQTQICSRSHTRRGDQPPIAHINQISSTFALQNLAPAPAKRMAITGARDIVKVRLFPQLHVSAAFPQRTRSFVV